MVFRRVLGYASSFVLMLLLSGCLLEETSPPPDAGPGVWVNDEFGVSLQLESDGTGSGAPIYISRSEACTSPESPSYSDGLRWSQMWVEGGLPVLVLRFEVEGESRHYNMFGSGKRDDPWSTLMMFPCGDPDTTYPIILERR